MTDWCKQRFFGLMAYPAQGIYKSARSLSKTAVEQAVILGRTAMLEESFGASGVEPKQVIERFCSLK